MSQYSDSRPARRGFIFGAVIVGILILLAAVLIVSSLIGGGNTPSASPTPEPSSPGASAQSEQASICGFTNTESADSITTAPVADWVIVGTMAAPEDPEVGPGEVAGDGFRTCYARTATGALFAAANIWAMGSDAQLAPQITDLLTVPGAGRDAALNAQAGASTTGLSAQIAGFKILSYTGSTATVDIAFRLNTGDLISFPQKLEWSDGDWKVLLADDGSPALRPSNLQSLGGYIPWAGVG